jgi:hypothetical protein
MALRARTCVIVQDMAAEHGGPILNSVEAEELVRRLIAEAKAGTLELRDSVMLAAIALALLEDALVKQCRCDDCNELRRAVTLARRWTLDNVEGADRAGIQRAYAALRRTRRRHYREWHP